MSQVISNPFNELLNIMTSQGSQTNTPGISFGVIKSVEPLLVETQGIVLDSNFVKLAHKLKPRKERAKLDGNFNINLTNPFTPQISTYNMPSKATGLGATSTAVSTPTVTGGDGTVRVSVNTNVTTNITGDSHNHGSHNHTSSTLSNVTGNGVFNGTIEYLDYGIKVGDTVLLVCTTDNQQFFILDKI